MKCIGTYDGKEFWVDDARADKIQRERALANPPKNFNIEGNDVSNNNIAGVYDTEHMREKDYRKRGMYICDFMRWHDKFEICNCKSNYQKYKFFGYAPKSIQCIAYEKAHGALEDNLDEQCNPKIHFAGTASIATKN